jgi:hypothetical protein
MKKSLQYDSLIGFASQNSAVILSDKIFETEESKNQLSDTLYREYIKISNIEVVYQIKNSTIPKTICIVKNSNNFNGGSVSLPFKSSKVTLSTKVVEGFYSNTWIALQNRNFYMPKLTINDKKYLPVEVNGAFLKYQFHAPKENSNNNKPENNLTISVSLNPIDHVNSIVGIWFG